MGTLSYIIVSILALLCLYVIGSSVLDKDKSKIWQPLNVVSLVYIYYCIMPVLFSEGRYVITSSMRPYLCDFAALLSYLCLLWGHQRRTNEHFYKWNIIFTPQNALKICVALFLIGLVCYIPFCGFATSISYTDSGGDYGREGFTSYFIGMISLFCAACSLAIVALKQSKKNVLALLVIWFSFITYIVGGFRFRLVALIFSILVPSVSNGEKT